MAGGNCPAAPFHCSWDHNAANSWQANRRQVATQAFYAVSHFHDHLEASPIEFVPQKGNFDARFDGDGVFVESSDGANLAGGLPDTEHINNANMFTPPDGFVGEMQMYLFRPVADRPNSTVNGGTAHPSSTTSTCTGCQTG